MSLSKMIPFLLLLAIVCLASSCDEPDKKVDPVAGKVVNAYTNEPVANATVSLLDNGPTTTTDAEGNFRFSDELINEERVNANGDFAVRITHETYRFREANVPRGSSVELEVAPEDVPVYFYNAPVQLNDGIETGDLSDAGVDRQLIQDMMDKHYRDGYKEVHSILVYHKGMLVLEEYFHGNNDTIQFENGVVVDKSPAPIQWTRTEPHYVASVNKALTSTIVGIAMDQYDVSVDDKIAEFLPDYASYFEDENKAALDFEDCLTMTAGFQWDEWSSNDLALLWKSEEFGDFVLNRSNAGPGSAWVYNSALPNLLLKAVDNMVDGEVRQWAHDNFYQKLGITDYRWQYQPDGYPEGSARMYIRPRDMLKIGITYLNNGKWNGEQVIPASYVEECFEVKKETASGDYSYYFWLRELADTRYLSADGDGGNYINVFPEEDMVIVFTQGLYLKWPSYVSQADNMMKNYIIPAVR